MALNIGIAGTRGIPNHYGGFEQVAAYLSRELVERGHSVSVYSPHDHPYKGDTWEGVRILRCYCPALGTIGQFAYDLNCLLDARKRGFDVLLLLGYTSSSVWGRWYPKGPIIINNMDGMEWKRSKYSKPVRLFLRYAERLAVRYSHHYIADSTTVRDYLQWRYGVRSRYIPYGAEVFHSPKEAHLREYGVCPGTYSMLVARMEPENNIEMVLEGFSQSRIDRHLLVIGDTSHHYGKHLLHRFGHNPRILFGGPLFDQERLHSLRAGCHFYFHGHSVGGTNPSLLEAMASRTLIAAHDNPFNRGVLGRNAFYFHDVAGVTRILERSADPVVEETMIETNFKKIGSLYNWEKITSEYEQFMYDCYAEKRPILSHPAVPGLTTV
jgi:glycosyltransferase involved in cell wall biosynthesis